MKKNVSEAELAAHSEARNSRRVSVHDIEDAIASEHCFRGFDAAGIARTEPHPMKCMTFCVLVLKNGFTVTGQSACADPANYDKEIGERLARHDAINKMWPLMGFMLREDMHREAELLKSCAFEQNYTSDVYIGTKVIYARPMTRQQYNELRGLENSSDERSTDDGYLVEYTDRIEETQQLAGFRGYVSWSPKEVFERAYKKVGKVGA